MNREIEGLTRGALAEKTGVKSETIRYYEKVGLMPEPSRAANAYRVYDESHAKRLAFIKRCRELGFPQSEIASLLGLVDRKDYTCKEVQSYAISRIHDLDARIQDLHRIRRTLADLAAKCGGDRAPECPILDALYEP